MKIGAYSVERDYSHYVAYAAKTVFAVVGTATKGPVGKAILNTNGEIAGYEGVATVCTSTQDFVNKFGPLKIGSYGLYAGQYFLSQSSKLYYVRAVSKSAKASSTVLEGTNVDGTDILDALQVEAVEFGTYADGYIVLIDDGTPKADGTKTYNITVKNKLQSTLAVDKNIDMTTLVEGYANSYIKFKQINDTATAIKPGSYTLTGGNDGIEDITSADYINAAQSLISETVDMNLVAIPGQSDVEVIESMLSIVETRGDALYLIDPPAGLDRDGVVAWHNGGAGYNLDALNSSYGALYYDWVTIYDSVNKVKVNVPPSVVVAASIAYSDRTSELWFAPAGLNRGIVRGVLDSVTKLSKPDCDYLYSDENNINPLYDDPQVGLVIWGQKTLLRADTALNRVNVRRLLNYMKRVITAACNYLTFEPNDRVTWNSFQMKIEPVLKSIKSKRGIYEYRIIKGETIVTDLDIDNYRMPCMVMIRPTKAAEEIPIYFTITSTGADFNEVLEANGIIS